MTRLSEQLKDDWDQIHKQVIEYEREKAQHEIPEHQSPKRWRFAQSMSDCDENVFDSLHSKWEDFFETILKNHVKKSWSSSYADHTGAQYQFDNGPWPKEDWYYELTDGSVVGVINERDGQLFPVRLKAF